jgi:hypothetical protein
LSGSAQKGLLDGIGVPETSWWVIGRECLIRHVQVCT